MKSKPGEPGDLRGVLRLDEDELSLEWRKMTLIERHHKKVHEIRIPISELDAVEIEKGFFKSLFILRPRKMELVNTVPGEHDSGGVDLYIKHRHRKVAAGLAARLKLLISEYRLKRLTDSIG